MTHTPGPWRLNKDRVSVAIPYRGEHCVTSTYGGTEANARLIATAPDLLDALEWLHLGKGKPVDIAAVLARATTASKEGE